MWGDIVHGPLSFLNFSPLKAKVTVSKVRVDLRYN